MSPLNKNVQQCPKLQAIFSAFPSFLDSNSISVHWPLKLDAMKSLFCTLKQDSIHILHILIKQYAIHTYTLYFCISPPGAVIGFVRDYEVTEGVNRTVSVAIRLLDGELGRSVMVRVFTVNGTARGEQIKVQIQGFSLHYELSF